MKIMSKSFKNFLEKGYTERQRSLSKKSVFHRLHFRFGHIFGYSAWRAGISVTFFTYIRFLLIFLGFFLLLFSEPENLYLRLLGAVLLILQKVMDYGDGALARVSKTSSPSGRQLDILSDISPKLMIFCLLAYFSNIPFFVYLSGFLCYIFIKSLDWITFGRTFVDESTNNPYFVSTKKIDRNVNYSVFLNYLNSFPVMLYLIPIVLAFLRDATFFPYFAELNMYLFTLYFISNSILFYQCLKIN